MTVRLLRVVGAFLGAAVMLVGAAWFDTTTMSVSEAPTGFAIASTVGYVLSAAAILGVALLARWAASPLVDVGYALVGAFFAVLQALAFTLAASVNGAPPVLPDPLASFLSQAYVATEAGVANVVALMGAGMLVVGATRIGLALRRRATRTVTAAAGDADVEAAPTPAGVVEWMVGLPTTATKPLERLPRHGEVRDVPTETDLPGPPGGR